MSDPGGETDGLWNLDLPELPVSLQPLLLTMTVGVVIPTVRIRSLTVAEILSMLTLPIVN